MKKLLKKIPTHLNVALVGWTSRLIVVPVQLLAIPIFYQRLGLQNFAIFTIITSLAPWYQLMDFGIGTALQNHISEYRAQNKDPAILLINILPIIYLVLLVLAILISILGGFFERWLFNRLPNSLSAINFIIIFILYSWYFVFLIGTKVFFAYQKGFLGYFYQSVAYVVLLVLIGSIHFFIFHLSLAIALYIWVIPLFIFGLVGFFHAFRAAGAQFHVFHWNRVFYRRLRNNAIQYWLVSLSTNGVVSIDYLVIVKLLTAKDIVTYNIVNKIFIMMLFAYAAVLTALWPTLTEHFTRKTVLDMQCAERQLRRTIVGGIIYMVFATALVLFFRKEILDLFRLQQAIELPILMIILFGIYGCVRIWTDTYTVSLQSRSLMQIFLILTPFQAVISIASMIYLSRFGLAGILIALTGSFIVTSGWILPMIHYRLHAATIRTSKVEGKLA